MRIPQVSDRMKEAPVQALRAAFAGIGQLLLAADRLWNRSEPAGQAEPAAAQQAAQAEPAAAQQGGQAGKASATQRGRQGGRTAAQHQPSRWRSLDETGNVRLLSPGDVDDELTQRAGLPAEPPAASLLVEPGAPSLPAEPGASLQIGEPSGPGSVLAGGPEPAVVPDPAAVQQPALGPETAAVPDPAVPEAAAVAEPARTAKLPVPGYDSLSIASLRARLRNLSVAQLRVLADYERAGRARSDVLTMFERRIAKLEAQG